MADHPAEITRSSRVRSSGEIRGVLAAAAGCLLVAGCGGEPAAPGPQSARPDRVTVSPGPDGRIVVRAAQ